MQLYDTMTRSKKTVVPLSGSTVGLYACGPTVYDFTHIGHLRKYIMDDVLVRVLRHAGFSVKHVENITDVGHLVSDDDTGEDKMEKGARKYGQSVWDVAKRFEQYYWDSMQAVNVVRPEVVCRATEHIPEQIALVQDLEKNGYTYVIEDGVYFDTSKLSDYGALARLDPEKLMAGARVEMVAGKKHPTDFALWKFSPKNEQRQMEWESPWGKGFPGWHIECSAMSMKYLGPRFDIHTGGIDHIPVHHTNEIAQSEAATGQKPFVNIWVHHNFVRVNNEKMSKSLGNVFTIDDVRAKGFSPMALRLLFLGAQYRSELNFTWENLQASQVAWERLLGLLAGFQRDEERTVLSPEKLEKIGDYRRRFFEFLEDDLRTPEALAVVWEVTKSNVPGTDKFELIEECSEVLGLNLSEPLPVERQTQLVEAPETVKQLAQARWQLKQAGQFKEADEVRAKIAELGWQMNESASEYTLSPKKV